MWRCHCGETNPDSRTHCIECEGPRLTHEDRERQPRRRVRQKTVHVGFFGMGMGDDRGREERLRRPMSELELDAYFERSRRGLILQWIAYGVLAVVVVALLFWQVLRRS
jgi:hypothetical protein